MHKLPHKIHHHLHHTRKAFNEHTLINRLTLSCSYVIFFVVIFQYLINQNLLFSKASTFSQTPQQPTSSEKVDINIRSNQILVKVKTNSRSKVKTGITGSRGIKTIDQVTKNRKIKQFDRIINNVKNSSTSSDVYSWYILTYDEPLQKLSGTLDKKTKRIYGNDKVAEIDSTLTTLRSDSDVEAAEPNYILTADAINPDSNILGIASPNDPYLSTTGSWGQTYDDLWGLKRIHVSNAWALAGNNPVVVASIDTGVDRNHPDIANNMWVNTKEIPNNGIDDDGNGYIDDYYGWDFVNNDNDPMDDYGHGTHTAGTIAATANNAVGIAGVSQTAKIMALKFMDSTGSGPLTAAVSALKYSVDNGAKISSNSWGCGTTSCWSSFMDDGIAYAYDKGQTIVASAGNSNLGTISFATPSNSERVISVGATDSTDAKSSFSNYGAKLDVMAPGTEILSLQSAMSPMCASRGLGNGYCHVSGTSMAAPHVSGVAALLLSINPNLTSEQIRQIIRVSSQDLGTVGRDMTFGYGLLNAQAAVSLAQNPPLAPYISNLRTRQTLAASQMTITGTANGSLFKEYRIEIGHQPGNWKVNYADDYGLYPPTFTVVKTSTTPVTNGPLGTIDLSQLTNGLYTVRLVEKDTNNRETQFEVLDLIVDSYTVQIDFPKGYISKGSIEIYGKAIANNPSNYDHFELAWGQGASPTTWSTSGITNDISQITANGKNGKLATIDTSSWIANQVYTLKLTIFGKSGGSLSTTTQTTLDPEMVSNFPKMLPSLNDGYDVSVPVLADLDNDGKKEIIVQETQYPGKLHAYRKDGSELPGFPITYSAEESSPNWAVTVEDINGDGKKEIISTRGLKVFVYQSNGTLLSPWPRTIFSSSMSPQYYDRTPIAVDLNGDGNKELVTMEVLSGNSGKLHVMKADGSYLPGFPKTVNFLSPPATWYKYGSVSAADMNRDGKAEIAFPYGRNIYLYDTQGNLIPGWPYIAPSLFQSSPTFPTFTSTASFADVNGDGKIELFAYAEPPYNYIYLLSYDGTLWSGGQTWPLMFTGAMLSGDNRMHAIGATDLDNDGKDEFFGSSSSINPYKVLTKGQGGLGWLPIKSAFGGSPVSISDLTGDKQFEYLATSETSGADSRYYGVVNWANSTQVWERRFLNDYNLWPNSLSYVFRGPVLVADLDNNGKMEIVTVRQPSYITNLSASTTGGIYVWEINPTTAPAHYEWPMYQLNPARTGRLNLKPTPIVTPTITTIPTPTNPPCKGQCKGDPQGTLYSTGNVCFGMDNQCYVCGSTGSFINSKTACLALPTSGVPTPTGSSSCVGQCKGDPYGTTYTVGHLCFGNDNQCYICSSNGNFSTSTSCTASPTPSPIASPTPTMASCTGQCKGDAIGTKYQSGNVCYGMDNLCYVCSTNGSFTKSTTACASLPTPTAAPTSTPSSSCKGQCQGDAAGTSYTVGHACYGNDNQCYVCSSSGNFSTSQTACLSIPTPTPPASITCKGQCKGDAVNTTYQNGYACYGNDDKCYLCGSNGNFSVSPNSCSPTVTP